ncbi:hypothetical protein TRICHSKD4_0988 [Roseibium sp. TrichSKD4]|nr:hypothetical protein TRICHSKD4_0988 [Roseibium sp. TrichSKD4]
MPFGVSGNLTWAGVLARLFFRAKPVIIGGYQAFLHFQVEQA